MPGNSSRDLRRVAVGCAKVLGHLSPAVDSVQPSASPPDRDETRQRRLAVGRPSENLDLPTRERLVERRLGAAKMAGECQIVNQAAAQF